MSYVLGLKCRECGREYPKDILSSRPKNMWRYKELLPLDKEPTVGLNSGFTPFIRSNNLAKALGVKELYIKLVPRSVI